MTLAAVDPCVANPGCGRKPLDVGWPWWFVIAALAIWGACLLGIVLLGRRWLRQRAAVRRGRRRGAERIPPADVELYDGHADRPRRAHVEFDEPPSVVLLAGPPDNP